jgi:hypothetical protein
MIKFYGIFDGGKSVRYAGEFVDKYSAQHHYKDREVLLFDALGLEYLVLDLEILLDDIHAEAERDAGND